MRRKVAKEGGEGEKKVVSPKKEKPSEVDGDKKKRAPRRRKPREPKCFNCDAEGHVAKECTEPPKPKACFNCGEAGHLKADCPKTTA